MGFRSSLAFYLLHYFFYQGGLPKPHLRLFVISAFNRQIKRALTLVLRHIPAPRVTGQDPLSPIRPLMSLSPRQNTCLHNSFWEFDAVKQPVRCFVTPHLRLPAHPPPMSQDTVCRQQP